MSQLALAVLLVVLSSGFCSGAEAALLALPTLRARQLAEQGGPRARALLKLKLGLARPISAIVVLNNVANIVGAMFVGQVATRVLGSAWLGLFSAVLTALIIVFAEIVPKTLGARFAERIGLALAQPITGLVWLMTPLLWVIALLTNSLGSPDHSAPSEAQIRFLVRQGGREGTIDADESELIQRVFELDDRRVRDILTPRTQMTWLRAGTRLSEQAQRLRQSQHSRLILVGETLDDVHGMLLLKELLLCLAEDRDPMLEPDMPGLRRVRVVPPDLRADALLESFLRGRTHLAVVRDEFGQTQGVVTLEDVLEILVGEIVDETDHVADLQAAARKLAGELP